MSITTFHNIRYADIGDRTQHDAVVLLHGFAEQLELWQDYTQKIGKYYRVIVPDLRGHTPGSHIKDSSWSINDMAWDIKTLLDYCTIHRAVLIGHSMGGYVALKMAKLFPDRIKGLSLFHSHPFADTDAVKHNRTATITRLMAQEKADVINGLIERILPEEFRTQQSSATESLRVMMMKPSAEGLIGATIAMRDRTDTTNVLVQAQYPVQFIIGGQDSIVPRDQLLALVPTIRSASVEYLHTVGHQGMVESPAVCLKILQAFITRCW
jgi:3-oxoadipate enol-lactonase